MEENNKLKLLKEVLTVVVICTSIITGILIVTNTYRDRNIENEIIDVKGLGEVDFDADLIIWSGRYTRLSENLKSAYALLNNDQEIILDFLSSKGIKESEIVLESISINKEYRHSYDEHGNRISHFVGFRLGQQVKIESANINQIEDISREITEIINKGVEFYSHSPQYLYTKLRDLKIELIEKATENARIRAEKIADQAGSGLGRLKFSKMGVLQIIARNSNEEYTWAGAFNTSSRKKTAVITMQLQYGVK